MSIAEAAIAGILDWIVERGLAGDDEIALLNGFCERCVAAGLAPAEREVVIRFLQEMAREITPSPEIWDGTATG